LHCTKRLIMSSNNHALIRYRTIDRCLKSQSKNYFLKDLIKACSDAVHEYEEHRSGKIREFKEISRRSLMYDLKFMKDDAFGFAAPIDHDREEGYYYTDPTYQAFKATISRTDKQQLDEALNILKQLSGHNQFKDLDATILRLEDTYQIRRTQRKRPTVQFEHSTNIEGIKWLSTLKRYISDKQTLRLRYHPFDAEAYDKAVSPYLIKEFNNRWYLVGYDHEKLRITNLGLDRIKKVDKSILDYYLDETFDQDSYQKDIVGITLPQDSRPEIIHIKAHGKQRYYVDTKPFHDSQVKIKETKNNALFELNLVINYELITKFFAMSDTLEVIKPAHLKRSVIERITAANKLYKSN